MKVTLVNYTNKSLWLATIAGKACRDSEIGRLIEEEMKSDYWQDLSDAELGEEANEMQRFVKGIIARDEASVIEHIVLTFFIEDISRVVSHELVRHRIASYSQLSMRCPQNGLSYVLPNKLRELPKLQEAWENFIRMAHSLYIASHESGMTWDEARYCLPLMTATNIMVTMNMRSFRNFLKLRMSKKANFEIRELARVMFDVVFEVMPIFLEDLKPLREEDDESE